MSKKSRVPRSKTPLVKTSIALDVSELALLDALSSDPASPDQFRRRSRNDLIRFAIRSTFGEFEYLIQEK